MPWSDQESTRSRWATVGEFVGEEKVIINVEDGRNPLYSYLVFFFHFCCEEQ